MLIRLNASHFVGLYYFYTNHQLYVWKAWTLVLTTCTQNLWFAVLGMLIVFKMNENWEHIKGDMDIFHPNKLEPSMFIAKKINLFIIFLLFLWLLFFSTTKSKAWRSYKGCKFKMQNTENNTCIYINTVHHLVVLKYAVNWFETSKKQTGNIGSRKKYRKQICQMSAKDNLC